MACSRNPVVSSSAARLAVASGWGRCCWAKLQAGGVWCLTARRVADKDS